MVTGVFRRYAVSIGMPAIVLAACVQTAGPPVPGAFEASTAQVRAERRVAWMLPEAKSEDLLYVTNQGSRVYVLSYPAGKLVGELGGFNGSAGECVDAPGNIWIADEAASEILEYAHGGTRRKATLQDRLFYPQSCAVDPTTGNLAVTNFRGFKSTGDVLVYSGAQGKPKRYVNSNFAQYYYCAYDARGNLFIDGTGGGYNQYAVLPRGRSKLESIELPQNLYINGGIQRDGKFMVWGGWYGWLILYRTTGLHGHVAGATDINGGDTLTFWIENHMAIAGGYFHGLAYWKYPAGGHPFEHVHAHFFPYYIVVSHAGQPRN